MHDIDERYVKAARELLRWTQGKLAERAGLSLTTVKRFEADGAMRGGTEDAIRAALAEAGVVFLPAADGDPPLAGAVALTASAVPEPPPPKRVYNYRSATRGRPRKAG